LGSLQRFGTCLIFCRVWFAPGGSALSFEQKQTKTNQIKSKILIK